MSSIYFIPEFIGGMFVSTLSMSLVFFETLITIITMLLPQPVITMFTAVSKRVMQLYPAPGQLEFEKDAEQAARSRKVAAAPTFTDICNLYGYDVEEHVVVTRDGYLLMIHRITGHEVEHAAAREGYKKPVVYLHHGLLMNSEIWVAVEKQEQSIAFDLVNQGFDVWLGNNRGNKYSKKHTFLSSKSPKFWNFCMDEFALYDIPDTIDYIIDLTGVESLSYVGFSQGSAQGFASLSTNARLNTKIDLFIALAPAMAPPGVNPIIQNIMSASPSMLFFLFGRRIILRSSAFWQNIMSPDLFLRAIDASCDFLFQWKGKNITYGQKIAAYPHLYSFASVKTVVHWFQIIRSGTFQMYDDDTMGQIFRKKFYKPLSYPTRNIKTPILLIYGGNDSLVEIDSIMKELPPTAESLVIKDYEHLDLIWGQAVPTQVSPEIVSRVLAMEEQKNPPYGNP